MANENSEGGFPMSLTDKEREARRLEICIYDVESKERDFHPCSLLDFVSDNRDDPETCAEADALPVGESFVSGGGAGVLFTIRRVA
jgi:hypothetical protein